MVGAEMIPKRYPGLFNIFADSNQRVVEHFTPAQAVLVREISARTFATGAAHYN